MRRSVIWAISMALPPITLGMKPAAPAPRALKTTSRLTSPDITTTGTVAPAILLVAGAGSTRTVTVSTGGGEGTIRLNVIDDDSIIDIDGNPLGGPGAGNGDFTTGEEFLIANPAGIPALDPRALLLLAVLLAGAAVVALRQL